MKITGKLEWEEYLEAVYVCRKISISSFSRIVLYISAGLWVLTILIFAVLANFNLLLLSLILFLATYLLLNKYILFPRRVKRLFYQGADWTAPFEMELTEERISTKNEFGNSDFPWKIFIRWEENEKIFSLFLSENSFKIIPKRLIVNSDDQLEIRNYLKNIEQQAFGKGNITYWLLSAMFIFFNIYLWYIVLT